MRGVDAPGGAAVRTDRGDLGADAGLPQDRVRVQMGFDDAGQRRVGKAEGGKGAQILVGAPVTGPVLQVGQLGGDGERRPRAAVTAVVDR